VIENVDTINPGKCPVRPWEFVILKVKGKKRKSDREVRSEDDAPEGAFCDFWGSEGGEDNPHPD
jgi:hypothetical protein